jgi:hypothetical protein
LKLVPQIVIDANCVDKTGAPLCVEQYAFSPSTVLNEISLEEYIIFVIYSLEFKSLILEQLSEERERALVKQYEADLERGVAPESLPPHGVILHTCVIRDLSGIGFEHLGTKGQEIIKAVVGVASDNYPELMHKCHMINTPWLFNTVWWVIKGWLAPRYILHFAFLSSLISLPLRTISKVNVLGSSFRSELEAEVEIDQLPDRIGGQYTKPTEPFEFDYHYEGAMLWTPPRETMTTAPSPSPLTSTSAPTTEG